MEIVAATRNRRKLGELERMLVGMPVVLKSLEDFPGCPDVPETEGSFEGNARLKALAVAKYTGLKALADDSGLVADALGGEPGVRSARYAGQGATDADNVDKLLREMSGVPDDERTARFECVLALAEPGGRVETFEGTVQGRIGRERRGASGFGYDPVFYPEGEERTFAEMDADEKDSMSHRGRALRKFARRIRQSFSARDKIKVVVVMPAYNAAETLLKTYRDIPKDWVDEIILVDDYSGDRTVEVARSLNLKVISHRFNIGYGGNQKTCYNEALAQGADVVVMLHPDYQYDPRIIPDIVEPFLSGEADAVFASRMLGNPLKGGMPLYKYVANRMLTALQNLAMGIRLSEYHTGYRGYSRRVLERVPYLKNSNGFVFDNEIIAQLVWFGFRIKEVPVRTRYGKDSSSVGFLASVRYGLGVLRTIWRYTMQRLGIRKYPFLMEKEQ